MVQQAAMYKMVQLLGMLVTTGLLSLCMAETFHVTPTFPAPADCPKPCQTLDYYAQNQNLSAGHNNITLIFLEGVHNLSSELTVNNTNLIIMQPALPNQRQRPKIIGRCDTDNGGLIRIIGIALNTLIEELLFENVSLKLYRSIDEFSNLDVDSSITIKNSIISRSTHASIGVNAMSVKNCLIEDTTIYYILDIWALFVHDIPNVMIVNSNISHNSVGLGSANSNITLRNSSIDSNDFGVWLIDDIEKHFNIMDNCSFTRNKFLGIWLGNAHPQKTVTTINDCKFDNNSGTPILASGSTFHLSGENVFSNNIAVSGGGLALYQSTVLFDSGSSTRFENNTAMEYGGGIYIVTDTAFPPQLLVPLANINLKFILNPLCFYNSASDHTSGDIPNVTFFGNNAYFGGKDIFGLTKISVHNNGYGCSVSEDSIFHFDDSVPSFSRLASNPSRVCFCVNDTQQCQNRIYLVVNETRFPGENFDVFVVLVGFNFSRVTGTVFATVLDGNTGNISDIQRIQYINDYAQCTKLTYTVMSNQTSRPLQLSLSAEQSYVQGNHNDISKESVKSIYSDECSHTIPCAALLTTSVFINITVNKCPLGFQLDKTSGVCECDKSSTQLNVTCDIQNHTGYIIREGTVWVGVDTVKNETDLYYLYQYCPSDYCNRSAIAVHLTSPDSQCSSNRTGILCGRCDDDHSLQLGGDRCIQCHDNSFVALLIVFATLGILLVAMITLFNVTVANGTINGLLFYANVVWINNAILFPQRNIGYYIITVPIAWINLDFDIETCFSQNLDQLTKSGLQFVFPVYIWCIAGLIILVCRHSIKATQFFGGNSVAVLSTLILLSYGKLFRIITNVFTPADISGSDGSIRRVWSLDGNVEYGITHGHIILMVVALLFMLLFWLPFTLTLLLVPFLKAKSNYPPLRWINKFMPFFDTFYGPFKNKRHHQVWTGILLISRVVILIVFASTSTSNPNANILVLTIIATLLLLYIAFVGFLYTQWFASVLEVLYLFNLIILGGAFLFYQTQPEDVRQKETINPVTATSVCIALLQFTCIIIFHIAKKVGPKLQRLIKKPEIQDARKESGRHEVITQEVTLVNAREQHTYYNATDYREPLLDDTVIT
ncbi:uncharacterized protein LOC135348604 [Halichondria panicea]|uniref:uncharacterized protein LOC135348604 n=1 Tax=Halichondria panicea TaxID=6063 RepID=UPI00312B4970